MSVPITDLAPKFGSVERDPITVVRGWCCMGARGELSPPRVTLEWADHSEGFAFPYTALHSGVASAGVRANSHACSDASLRQPQAQAALIH
jgi:hypothetical protein